MKHRHLATCSLLTVLMTMAAATAHAEETTCVGTLPAGTYDSIVVPAAAQCTIDHSLVTGHIRALDYSVLRVLDTTVQGNIEAHNADVVQALGDTISGHIHIKGGGPNPNSTVIDTLLCNNVLRNGNIEVERRIGGLVVGIGNGNPALVAQCSGLGNTLLKGDLKIEGNTISPERAMSVTSNSVAKNMQVSRNTGSLRFKVVKNNAVDGTLRCSDNDAPFTGGPNSARRSEGQCF